MEEILNNLIIGRTLYTTKHGTEYLLIRINKGGITYSIKKNQKKLPMETIKRAFQDFDKGTDINAQWYRNYNEYEYSNLPCNLSVLNGLLSGGLEYIN